MSCGKQQYKDWGMRRLYSIVFHFLSWIVPWIAHRLRMLPYPKKRQIRSTAALRTVLDSCGCIILEFSSLDSFARLGMTSSSLHATLLNSTIYANLKYVRGVNSQTLMWILRRAQNLRAVKAAHSDYEKDSMSDDHLMLLAGNCKYLEEIDLTENKVVTRKGLLLLVQSCQRLKSLFLSKVKLSSDCLASLVVNFPPSLRVLDISTCFNVGDDGIVAVAKSCPSLQKLDISHCEAISDEGLIAVGLHCRQLEALTAIKIAVTDKGIMAVAEGCPLLAEANFSRCKITDAGVLAISIHLKDQLTLLDVSHNEHITDLSVSHVVWNCTKLKVLRVSWCIGVTDESIQILTARCPCLEQLYVRDCFFVSDVSLAPLRRTLPRVLIFDF